jgi:hypothetical protein
MGLSNSQYQAILREYDRIQAEERAKREERIEEVYQKIPELKTLNLESGKLALESYLSIREKKDNTIFDKLSKDIEDIKAKKILLLRKHGFSDDYTELGYKCDLCKDTGFVDGKKCRCFNDKVRKLLYEKSNIQKILERENFQTFSYEYFDDKHIEKELGTTVRKYMEEIVVFCKNFVENFPEKHENIIFIGNTGVGKTFLSNCITKELIDKYYSAIYLSAAELFEYVARAKMEDDMFAKEINEHILEDDVLIIDDLGTELVNTFTSTQLFYIINHRINAEKSTIISTNLSLKLLRDNYSDRIVSRFLSSYDIIKIYGEDIRKQKL